MEVKLIFRNFKKIFSLNFENPNYVRAFKHLKVVVIALLNITGDECFDLYWKDKDNDFIYFDTQDEFGLALDLNKDGIEIYVRTPNDVEFVEKCSSCQTKYQYIYQCVHCPNVILCKNCFENHVKDEIHFGILEKSEQFQIHPFFFRELNTIDEPDLQINTIYNIGSFFQKLLGNYGISLIDKMLNDDETARNTPEIVEEPFTLDQLNLKNNDKPSRCYDVEVALEIMTEMGYTNENNWLEKKLTEFNGNIHRTVDWINRQINYNN